MNLMTMNRTVSTLWAPVERPSTMYHDGFSVCLFFSYVSGHLVPRNLTVHVPFDENIFYTTEGYLIF